MSFPNSFAGKVIALGENSMGIIALTLWTFLKAADQNGWDDSDEAYWTTIDEPKLTDKKIDIKINVALGDLAPKGCYFGLDDDGNFAFLSADGFGSNKEET